MSKTVEEAFEAAIDKRKIEQRKAAEAEYWKWYDQALKMGWNDDDIRRYDCKLAFTAGYVAGAAHGAAEERKRVLTLIAAFIAEDRYGQWWLSTLAARIQQGDVKMNKVETMLVKAIRGEHCLTVEVFDIATVRELRTISQEVNARIKEIQAEARIRQRGEK